MNHPLTDEICEQIADTLFRPFTLIERENMRAAYDFAVEKITEQWENAVQSDLEHGVRCLNERYTKELISKYPRISSFGEVLEAMRPQEDNP
jgi:hypothetical protein